MTFTIFGTYQGSREEIDEADTKEEAERLAREYRLAYGGAWLISIKKTK